MLQESSKSNVLNQLSIAFIKVKQQKDFAPLFDLMEERSSSTATHSRGVSAVARRLAEQSGLCDDQCTLLALAGMLHDIGKMTIPDLVLNKAGPLSENERQVMRSHVEMSLSILKAFSVHPSVLRWCAFHHERLNGAGYPFGLNGTFLDRGCRIMSVADVFVALTEDRIYRKGMSAEEAVAAMEFMAANGNLDRSLYALLHNDMARYNDARRSAQQLSGNRFRAA